MVIDTDVWQAGQARLLRAGYGPRYVPSLLPKLPPNRWESLYMVISTMLSEMKHLPHVASHPGQTLATFGRSSYLP